MNTSPLRQARRQRELTLQAVADAVGTDTGNLSRVERGLQIPSKDLAERLAKFFGITELQIIYPERFASCGDSTGSESTEKPQE